MSHETKTYHLESLGYQLPYTAPAHAADIDRLMGAGFCASQAMKQYDYHQRGPTWRENFALALEAFAKEQASDPANPKLLRGRSTSTHKKTGAELEKYSESEAKYINRLEAGIQDDAGNVVFILDAAEAHRIALEENEKLGDWSPTQISERKPAAKFYEGADQIIAKIASGARTVESYVSSLETATGMPFHTAFGEWNRDNVARALKARDEKLERERIASL